MHSNVLYSIVLRRSQLYCVNLLLCGYDKILCINLSDSWTTLPQSVAKRHAIIQHHNKVHASILL